jgi:hypothetical protein
MGRRVALSPQHNHISQSLSLQIVRRHGRDFRSDVANARRYRGAHIAA